MYLVRMSLLTHVLLLKHQQRDRGNIPTRQLKTGTLLSSWELIHWMLKKFYVTLKESKQILFRIITILLILRYFLWLIQYSALILVQTYITVAACFYRPFS